MNNEHTTPFLDSSPDGIAGYIQKVDHFLEQSASENNRQKYIEHLVQIIQIVIDLSATMQHGFEGLQDLAQQARTILATNHTENYNQKHNAENLVYVVRQMIDLHRAIYELQHVQFRQLPEEKTPFAETIAEEETLEADFQLNPDQQAPVQFFIVDEEPNHVKTSSVIIEKKVVTTAEPSEKTRRGNKKKERPQPKLSPANIRPNVKKKYKKGTLVIGLDVGTSSIKLVVLRKQANQLFLEHWRIVEYNLQDKNLEAVLFQFLARYKQWKKIPVVTSLVDNSILIRYVTLPYMSDSNFVKSAELELQSELSINERQLKTFVFPSRVIETADGKKKSGFVIAIDQTLLQDNLSLFKKCKFNISYVNIDLFALTQIASKGKGKTRAIIDLGATKVKIAIIENDELRFARIIESYEHKITAEIADLIGVDIIEAEKLKRTAKFIIEGEANDGLTIQSWKGDQGSVQSTIYPFLSKLAEEIKLTLQFYNSNNEQQIESVQLVGGGALLKGIDHFLSTWLNLPVTIGGSLGNFQIATGDSDQILQQVKPQLATAIGLAELYLQQAKILKIDLRKKLKFQDEPKSKYYKWIVFGVSFFVFMTFGIQHYFNKQTQKLKEKIDIKSVFVAELEKKVEDLQKYEDRKSEIDLNVQTIVLFKQRQPAWSVVLGELSKNIPETVWINNFQGLHVEEGENQQHETENQSEKLKRKSYLKLSIKGQAQRQDQVQDFISRLEKNRHFKSAKFNKISSQKKSAEEYTEFDVEGNIQTSNKAYEAN